MNGRERLLSVINGQRPDRLAWTMLIDEGTKQGMASEHQVMSCLELSRLGGCDLMPFGTWSNPGQIKFPDVENSWSRQGEISIQTIHTPWGVLTAELRNGHPLRFPVQTPKDLDVYMRMWENSDVCYNPGCADADSQMLRELGDDGICVCTTQPSPVQHLLETELGMQFFYFMLHDEPETMEALLAVMHERYCRMYTLNAANSPYEVHIPVENTSTSYISPAIYAKYSIPQLRDYIDILHNSGKKAIVHMCGLLGGLLPLFLQTGMDGIHALTEAPIGNVSFDQVLDVLGEDIVMLGLLRGRTFTDPKSTRDQVWSLLDSIYTPRLRRSNFILCAAADGLPLDMEHFFWVRDWMQRYGAL